jgi:hypothetical protein
MNLTDILKQRKKKETLKEKLEGWWSYTKTYRIEIPYYDFKKGISNIFKWIKIVWKDHDFGYHDIVKVWRFKLEKTANEFEKKYKKAKSIDSPYYDDLVEQVKWMRLCCRLIDKVWGEGEFIDNRYEEEYAAYHKTEYIWQPVKENLEEAKKLAQSINRDRKIDAVLNDTEYEEIDLESEVELDLLDLEPDKPYNLNRKDISENFDEYFAENKLSLRKAKLKTGSSDKKVLAMTISEMKHKKAKRLLFKIIEQKIENWID